MSMTVTNTLHLILLNGSLFVVLISKHSGYIYKMTSCIVNLTKLLCVYLLQSISKSVTVLHTLHNSLSLWE